MRGKTGQNRRVGILGAAVGVALAAGPALAGGGALVMAVLAMIPGALPPVISPPENPPSEAKRVLGKILFFDEQLSSDNMVACATCHRANNGGSDPRRVGTPGVDGLVGTPDDVFGSPGVIRANAAGDYERDPIHGLNAQVTGRSAPSMIDAAFATDMFWDGRARSQFIDPQTGQVAIAVGGALESQSINPPLSSVEMAHAARDWNAVTTKLIAARPLAAATNLPADLAAVTHDRPTYPQLFQRAFGDGAITARRIAFALATYERTLVANDTPWDRSQAVPPQPGGLTPGQQQGFGAFQASNCIVCHAAPLFSDQTFRNIGLRPPSEDTGRQIVTGNTADRGKFKVPSLRNVGLRRQFMHNGQFTNLTNVIQFYARAPGAAPQFPDNRDPIMPAVNVPAPVAPALQDFIQNGLTDARVTNQTFPFDRPTLYAERPADAPVNLGGGAPGSGGIVPTILAVTPPFIGNVDFKIGLDRALGGTTAQVAVSSSPPTGGRVARDRLFGPFVVGGTGAGNGLATFHWPIVAGQVTAGQTVYVQWVVADPAGAGGEALSTVAQVRYFCGSIGCAPACPADWDGSGGVTSADIASFVNDWFGSLSTGGLLGDFDGNGSVQPSDVATFVGAWFGALTGGC